jgi:hypothetical protein
VSCNTVMDSIWYACGFEHGWMFGCFTRLPYRSKRSQQRDGVFCDDQCAYDVQSILESADHQ